MCDIARVEWLEERGVYIDSFRTTRDHKTATYLLSHYHTDHHRVPKQFSSAIHCHYALAPLLATTTRSYVFLVPGDTYRTVDGSTHYIPIAVEHSFESLGFWFPEWNVLFIGDGFLGPSVLGDAAAWNRLPLTVLYDDLMEPIQNCPMKTQCQRLVRTFEIHGTRALATAHHGILYYVSLCRPDIRWQLHGTVDERTRRWVEILGLEDPYSTYLLVGRACTDRVCIYPSSGWFIRNPEHDKRTPHVDGNKIRIFCSLHATGDDIRQWKETFSNWCFQPLSHRPLVHARSRSDIVNRHNVHVLTSEDRSH